jgi:signal transduction histidine kinase
VQCIFDCDQPVLIRESDIATHLFHIAQEAVNNSLKHGRPQRILIRLAGGDKPFLCVEDDGVGLSESQAAERPHSGMGLLIMTYRAKTIGGALEIRSSSAGGTAICCTFPARNLE